MPSTAAKPSQHAKPRLWLKIFIASLNLGMAAAALWLGMSIPSYFRSVSPLVLEAAAKGTPTLLEQAQDQLQSGRPGLALSLIEAGRNRDNAARSSELRAAAAALIEEHPAYRWSGGPAPFFEQFLQQAAFLREDETAVIPTLLPGEHRRKLLGFLKQSPNRNVQEILKTREWGGWQRFYPVYSTSGHPLEATILATALLEQADALPAGIRADLMQQISLQDQAGDDDSRTLEELESIYIGILALGRHTNWLQLKTLVQELDTTQELLFAAQAVQEEKQRLPLLIAAFLNIDSAGPLTEYLFRYGEAGWAGLATSLKMGQGAVGALIDFDKPVYHPPGFWFKLPAVVRESQQLFNAQAEAFPTLALGARVFAFGLCGIFLVAILRTFVRGLRPAGSTERRILMNLDSVVGAVLVSMLVWVLIEPGLLDFRPNEQGTLQIKLAQTLPDDTLSTTETVASAMIDQVTILVLLLFFVMQLLIFILGLLKIAEIRRQKLTAQLKLHLIDNEENMFDLGLYVGLGGTVSSLILVVLNIVDASLMAAYASTLFGIIFVALLKVAFLRPFRRELILERSHH